MCVINFINLLRSTSVVNTTITKLSLIDNFESSFDDYLLSLLFFIFVLLVIFLKYFFEAVWMITPSDWEHLRNDLHIFICNVFLNAFSGKDLRIIPFLLYGILLLVTTHVNQLEEEFLKKY